MIGQWKFLEVITMNEQEALSVLKEICIRSRGDVEYVHIEADDLLCTLLEKDYPNLVEEFRSLHKWYA